MRCKPSTCLLLVSLLALAGSGCNSPLSITGKKTPHEKYSLGLADAGLTQTILGKTWISAANASLLQPANINLPYRETGFFPAETPSAAGYRFTAKRGERITVNLETTPARGFRLFLEFWENNGSDPKILSYTDSLPAIINEVIDREGFYTIRIQPELLQPVGYTVTISAGPSLAFPVRKNDNPRASSFWGAARDGGGRSHEGVDIFAKKGTDVLAITPGRVTSVSENQLGGKVVFMRPDGKDFSLYYAHLDSQLVSEGQRVKPGDVIGQMGNTGNARTTPAHLHFGIYTSEGATDPWPFINATTPGPAKLTADTTLINQWSRTNASATLIRNNQPEVLESGTSVMVIAATADRYRVRLPDGREGYLISRVITGKPMKTAILKQSTVLQVAPVAGSAIISQVNKGSSITILSTFMQYQYVQTTGLKGWTVR
ncbi:MAG: peptidoglycan DD-metalloendopeptidase family protein [Chitinophagaceae bacterium]